MGLRYIQISVICYSSVLYKKCVAPDNIMALSNMVFPGAELRFNNGKIAALSMSMQYVFCWYMERWVCFYKCEDHSFESMIYVFYC
jgi:hypothetical protein